MSAKTIYAKRKRDKFMLHGKGGFVSVVLRKELSEMIQCGLSREQIETVWKDKYNILWTDAILIFRMLRISLPHENKY